MRGKGLEMPGGGAVIIPQLRPLGTRAAPSDAAALPSLTPQIWAAFLPPISPVSTPRSQRTAKAALGSPLGGCVGVQHPGALHPCPNRVHPGHHGLFFHTTPTPLDALVDAKHQNAPSHCLYLSFTLSPLSLSSSPRLPPFTLSLLLLLFPSCLPPSCLSVWSRCQNEQSSVVCFTRRLVAACFSK